jgi:glutamine amidotransferase
MIAVVSYNMGNVGSILNMLRRIGARAEACSRPEEIQKAEKIILPGVGAFDAGMKNLREGGWVPALEETVRRRGVPLLGICLGLQLLTERSEEGRLPGLGWIEAETVRFRMNGSPLPLKVPHMGWNSVQVRRAGSLFKGLEGEARFYFVHSYHLVCRREEDVLGVTNYGGSFAAAVQKENILGTQFHPEKSHRYGMTLLTNFVGARPC